MSDSGDSNGPVAEPPAGLPPEGGSPAPPGGRSWGRRWLAGGLVLALLLAASLTAMALGGADDRGEEADPPAPGDGHPDLPAVDRDAAAAAPTSPTAAAGERSPAPTACVQSRPGGPVFSLVATDDFDGPALDLASWYRYDSPGNAGFGLRRPSAIEVDDGLLRITARMIDGQLVSGGMAHYLNQTYGRWEFRVRTDPDPTGATSGVVLTWPASGNWPVDGENDMYETYINPERRPFSTFVHYGEENFHEELVHDADGTRWQTMAMEWTPDGITMYRGGVFAGEITKPEAIPHVPHHMTVQLDAWQDEMGEPVTMEVDWIKVYRLEEDGSC